MNPEHSKAIESINASAESLARTVNKIPADKLTPRPAPEEWSVLETLVHIHDVVVLVYGLRLRRLLAETEPTFANYDEEPHRERLMSQSPPAGDLLTVIVEEHQQLGRLLSELPDEEWRREGRHPELGPMSIEFLARRVAEHAVEHEGQIADTVRQLSG